MKAPHSSSLVVQIAYYGVGSFFPAVVLDPTRRWLRPEHGALPTLDEHADELLALRWSGLSTDLDGSVRLLHHVAHHAPAEPTPERLAHFADTLPASLRIITLPPTALLGPWRSDIHL
jgi:hypothetical protein